MEAQLLCCTLLLLLGLGQLPAGISRETPEVEETEEGDDEFLTVEEELARIDLLPRTGIETLVPAVEQWQTEELKIVEALIGTQILKNDGKFHLELIAPSVSIELEGTRLNVEMTAEDKIAKEGELSSYLHGQSLEQRLAVWGHQANISALIEAHRTSLPVNYIPFDIKRDDLFEFDIIHDLYDVLELEEEIVEQIKDGVFPNQVSSSFDEEVPDSEDEHHEGIEKRDVVKSEAQSSSTDEKAEDDIAKKREKRKMKNSSKWNLPIKYKFGNSMTVSEKNDIHQAINYWSNLTCITFSYSPSVTSPANRIVFVKISSTTKCGASYIGKRSFGLKNQIEIKDTCFNLGTILHEIGHSLGFYHEQSRPDRDTYVNVHWNNIPVWAHHNFAKSNALTYSIPYDYSSIMHYSSVVYGQVALTAKDNNYTPLMGQREGLTFFDVKLANFHYCATKCSPYSLVWNSCQNRGYRDPKSCGQCRCPPGFTGAYCTSFDPSATTCGASHPVANSAPQYIQSPNYGIAPSNHYQMNDKCTWIIHAPDGRRVIASFSSTFKLRSSSRCNVDYVEVRYWDITAPGVKYCGSSKPSLTFTSVNSKLMVLFESTGATSSLNKGFEMTYKTELCGLCDFTISPTPACRHVVSYSHPSTYYTRCGWWGKRCPRKRYSLAYKYQSTCCHGVLVDDQCKVSGCGGCKDKLVKNQPMCVPYAESKYVSEGYNKRCGFWGWGRCRRYRAKVVYYTHTPPACCSGFTLVGNRCIKNVNTET